MEQLQPGIFQEGEKIYTLNATPGYSHYGENLVERGGKEYREWNPHRSKAAAALMKDIDLGLEKDSEVLYLGAASGTTVSHFSDVISRGFVVAVEYSETVIRGLVSLAENRENIAPVLGDARKPSEYSDFLDEADVVFQDISQSDQAEIFLRNTDRYLKEGGTGLFAVKARSISSSRNRGEIFSEVKDKLRQDFKILQETELEPYEKEHLFLKLEKK